MTPATLSAPLGDANPIGPFHGRSCEADGLIEIFARFFFRQVAICISNRSPKDLPGTIVARSTSPGRMMSTLTAHHCSILSSKETMSKNLAGRSEGIPSHSVPSRE